MLDEMIDVMRENIDHHGSAPEFFRHTM